MASFFTFPHRWSPYQEMNLNLVGRETDLVGRETGAPQRIWDSSIFTGRVGRYTMCCYVSPKSPCGSNSLPCHGEESVAHSGALDWFLSVAYPWAVAWKCQSMRSMPSTACAAVPLLHGSAWKCRGCLPLSLAAPSFPHRTLWRLPIERRKEQVLKGKPVKEELR